MIEALSEAISRRKRTKIQIFQLKIEENSRYLRPNPSAESTGRMPPLTRDGQPREP